MSDFGLLVGQEFLVGNDEPEEEQVPIVLARVERLPHGHLSRPEPFSLTFEGPVRAGLPQGTYLFSHPCIGSQPIFIVPVSQDTSIRRYQAVFN